jgi:hypothetical protein
VRCTGVRYPGSRSSSRCATGSGKHQVGKPRTAFSRMPHTAPAWSSRIAWRDVLSPRSRAVEPSPNRGLITNDLVQDLHAPLDRGQAFLQGWARRRLVDSRVLGAQCSREIRKCDVKIVRDLRRIYPPGPRVMQFAKSDLHGSWTRASSRWCLAGSAVSPNEAGSTGGPDYRFGSSSVRLAQVADGLPSRSGRLLGRRPVHNSHVGSLADPRPSLCLWTPDPRSRVPNLCYKDCS